MWAEVQMYVYVCVCGGLGVNVCVCVCVSIIDVGGQLMVRVMDWEFLRGGPGGKAPWLRP